MRDHLAAWKNGVVIKPSGEYITGKSVFSYKQESNKDRKFESIIFTDNNDVTNSMELVKELANDISTMVKDGKLVLPTRTKTTRDVVYENDYKEISDAQIEAANALEEKINDEKGDDYKAIVMVRDLLQKDSIELPGRNLDEKKFLKRYMQEKMNIIELFMLDNDDDDDDDDEDMEGGKRKKHRRSRKKTSHKRKTKKNNKRKTKKQKTKRRKRTTIRKKK